MKSTPKLVAYIKALDCQSYNAELQSERWSAKDKQLLARIRKKKKWFHSYADAQKIVCNLQLTTRREYVEWHKQTPNMRSFFPARPDVHYKANGWRSWKHYLGSTSALANANAS